ncbi:MAG TPA: cyclic nucleotide-binding domain-containing protein [Chromatiales bacterium]|nr:cyclic nucleotide-binding domain-containing protein [Chromatiales bacterium]
MDESPYLANREHLIEKYGYLPLLGCEDRRYLELLLRFSKLRKYDMGEVITLEGEYDNWVYILLSGEVSVSKDEQELARIDTPGDAFGEQVLIDYRPRSATVEATADTICLAIDSSRISELEEADRDKFNTVFFRLLAETLSTKLRAVNQQLLILQQALEERDSKGKT